MRRNGLAIITALAMMLTLAGCATGSRVIPGDKSQSSRENAARIHTQLGQGYFRQGKLKMALGKLQTALNFDPDYAPAHTVLGALYTRIGNMPEAEKHYRRAVELMPTDGDTNNNFGAFLCREGKVDEGMPYFKKALADPFYKTRATAWTNAGVCQIRAGNYKQAEAKLRRALKLNPQYPDALYQMARAHYLQNDAFHASAYVQRYQALGISNPAVLRLGYDIETRLGNAESAQDYARQLRSKFPDSEQAQALDTTVSP